MDLLTPTRKTAERASTSTTTATKAYLRNQNQLANYALHMPQKAQLSGTPLYGYATTPHTMPPKGVRWCAQTAALCRMLSNTRHGGTDYWLLKIQHALPHVNCHFSILWIPSHCDVDGNEKADDLAKAGSESNQANVPISLKIRKAKIKGVKWTPSHPRAVNIYKERRTPKREVESKWSRKVRTIYARIRTGHANELQEYRTRVLEKDESPNCAECNLPEDTEHVLCHCVITEESRVRNWNGKVEMGMLVTHPEVCRRILLPRFPALKLV